MSRLKNGCNPLEAEGLESSDMSSEVSFVSEMRVCWKGVSLSGSGWGSSSRLRAAFALLTTDYKRRQRFDSDPSRLSPRHQHHAKSWSTRAGQFEEEMIQAWINTL